MKRLVLFALSLAFAAMPMAASELAAGAAAPGFTLTNTVSGKPVTFVPASGHPAVVVFTCNSCPYARAFEGRLVELGKKYAAKGVTFYAVNANDDQAYASETAAEMKERAADKSYPYPYLKDADSAVARQYGARVTPHVFLVDGKGIIRYRGFVDDSAKPEERSAGGLSDAIDALLAGKPIANAETKAFGCSIKFKPTR